MTARGTQGGPATDPVEHGFPHLETVRAAITALYKRVSWDTVRNFDSSVAPADVAFSDAEDVYAGVQRVARVMVQHFRLPDARMIVSFREMEHAANVELAAGPEYFIELNDRFKRHRRDIGAALAHEVMHVYLHRLGLSFAGTRDNEILTDTATTYLGAGWLLLDAFREDAVSSQKLGYLTPEEFGYVLAKRARSSARTRRCGSPVPQAYDGVYGGPRPGPPRTRRARRSPRPAGRAAAATPGTAATRWTAPGLLGRCRPIRRTPYAFEGRSPAAGLLPLPDLPSAHPRPGAGPGAGALRAVPDGAGVRHLTRRERLGSRLNLSG